MDVPGPPLAAFSVSHHLNAIYLFVTLCLLSFWLLPKLRLAHSDNFIGIGFCLSLVTDWLGVRVGTGPALGDGASSPAAICHTPVCVFNVFFFFPLSCLPRMSSCMCVVCFVSGPFGTLLHIFEVIIQFALLFFRAPPQGQQRLPNFYATDNY